MLWLLIISAKGAYKLHSAHTTSARAEEWKECKTHDGDDCEVVELDKDSASDLFEVLGKAIEAAEKK
jgi:hypothetical protein